jgi:hypothetical protein
MTDVEIERLKQLNCVLFKHGYAQVQSISEWDERVRTNTVRQPSPIRIASS